MPNTVEVLPLSRVLPHGKNPRTNLEKIDELTESIKAQGVLEPLIVAPLNGTQYTIIAGHRRREAAKKAGLLNVPCWIREDLDTPDKQLAAMLVENTQRVDLTPIEEADAYAQLVAFPGWNQAKAAKATGRDAKTVKARIAIAKLPLLDRIEAALGVRISDQPQPWGGSITPERLAALAPLLAVDRTRLDLDREMSSTTRRLENIVDIWRRAEADARALLADLEAEPA